jgi:predicted permease
MPLDRLADQRLADLRHAARRLWKAPGFTAVALITLALGIGVNTAIFTLTEAVLLKPLPVRQPHEIFSLGDTVLNGDTATLQDSFTLYSYPLFLQLRDRMAGVSGIAAFQSWLATISVRPVGIEGQPRPAKAEYVSGNYFALLGVGAATGRVLRDEDDRPQSPAVAVISDAAWARSGRDRRIVGGTVVMNGVPVTIAGVAAAGFFGETLRTDPPDYWLPLSLEPAMTTDNPLLQKEEVFWLYVLARAAPGTRVSRLQTDVTREVRQWMIDRRLFGDRERPRIEALRVAVTPASGGIGGLQRVYGDGLKLLTILSAFVLAIACVNIANLLLARGAGLRSQFAVRVALGATRGRLVTETVTEGLLLAIVGGIAGLGVSTAITPAVAALALRGEEGVPFSTTPSIGVMAYTFALAVVTGLLFSAIPAWRSSDLHPADALRGASRGTRDTAARPQRWLLGGQTAFSLVLLVGAGLLTMTLRNLERQSLGFVRDQVVIVGINPALDGYTVDRLDGLYRKLDDRLPRIPGVLSASYALHAPLDEWNWGMRLQFDGQPTPTDDQTSSRAWYSRVSPHYFDTIGTRLRRGRAIDAHDTTTSARVAVVNEAFVARFVPHDDPIGRRFGSAAPGHGRDFEIVGVVENAKYRDVRQPEDPMFFLPFTQAVAYDSPVLRSYQNWSMFVDGIQLRVAGSVSSVRPAIERAMRDVDPNLTILRVRPLDAYVDVQLNSPRLLARLTALYGGVALLLACVGLYGVTAYTVTRRTRDLGVRMALGATRARVISTVCGDALRPIVIGLLVGVPAAIAGGRAIASQLFGVGDAEVMIVAAAVVALGICATAAAIIPARRAGTVDPLVALRAD